MVAIIRSNPSAQAPLWRKTVMIVGWFGLFAFLGVNLFLSTFYTDHVIPGTVAGGVNLSNLTASEAVIALQDKLDSYRVTVSINDKSYQYDPAALGASYDAVQIVRDAISRRDGMVLPLPQIGMNQGMALPLSYELDGQIFDAQVKKISTENTIAPTDATVAVEDGQPVIVPDQSGLGVKSGELSAQLTMALDGIQQSIKLTPQAVPAAIKSDDVKATVTDVQRLVATDIVLSYQGKTYIPSPSTIGKWLVFAPGNRSVSAGVDASKVKSWVQTIANNINIVPQNKLVTLVNGEVKQELGGVDGLAIDQDGVTKALADAVTKARALSMEIPTGPVAYKTVYNKTISLDYGRYIEVNLSRQHLWVYEDHNVVYDTPITSGATGAGFPTVTGLFSIYYKTTNTHLVGYAYGPAYNYDVAVKYWMPFYSGYGLHDASWRNGNFGGSDYYYGGSHGCVNLPDEAAAWIYNFADIGTPVWVHL
jgi:lipoprotein-anchoring transpeptidase ErfK/SrfK